MSIHKFSFILILQFFVLHNLFSQNADKAEPVPYSVKNKYRYSWQYIYKKGLLQYKAQMYDYAIESMSNALEKNDRLFMAANVLGHIYLLRNYKRKTLKYYNISLKINNKQADIHCTIGELYEFYIEKDLAFYHFKEAVRIDPSHVKAHMNLFKYYYKIKDKKNADKHFKISYDLGLSKSQKFFTLALKEEEKGNLLKAIDLHKEVIKVAPARTEAYLKISEIYRRLNNFKKAVEYLEKLKFLKPDHEKAYIHLGHIYFNRRLPGKRKYLIELAIENFKKAIELNPKNYEAYSTLARIYDYIGEDIKAREMEKIAQKIEKVK